MFRSILIPAAVLLTFTTSLLAQQEMPADIAVKLNEKAEKLFPNNAKDQDKWLNAQNENYMLLPMLQAPVGNEEIFKNQIKALADKKFDLDFTAKAKFIQEMSDGLLVIDAYKSAFGENTALFEKMKADVLKANPEDFKRAAKDFEAQSQMMLEIDSLPRNQMVDDALFYGIKAAANKKFPNDFKNQKSYIENILNIFIQFEQLSATSEKADKKTDKQATQSSQRKELAYQETLQKSQVFVRSEKGDAIGIITSIKDKPVILFPKSLYSLDGMSIVNNLDEPVVYSDVLVAKNSPVAIAIVKSLPEEMKPLAMIKTETLKDLIQKPVYLYSYRDNAPSLRPNQILSLKQDSLNLSARMPRGVIQGSGLFAFDENGTPTLLGVMMNDEKDVPMPNFINKSQIRDFERITKSKKDTALLLRIDEISGWQKVDTEKFAEESSLLNTLTENNKAFTSFFTVNNLNELSNIEVFNPITNKYIKLFKEQKMDEGTVNKNVKNIISEVIGLMGKDIRKLDISSINPILRADVEFQAKLRLEMIDSLKTALKKNQIKRFTFDDIKQNRF